MAIIEQADDNAPTDPNTLDLPDGPDNLGAHNLLTYRLFINHRLGLSAMTYTVDDFIRETHQEIIANLTPEERLAILQAMPAEERLRGLDPEERLQGLDPEERLRGLDPDALRSLDPEAREMLRQVLGKLK